MPPKLAIFRPFNLVILSVMAVIAIGVFCFADPAIAGTIVTGMGMLGLGMVATADEQEQRLSDVRSEMKDLQEKRVKHTARINELMKLEKESDSGLTEEHLAESEKLMEEGDEIDSKLAELRAEESKIEDEQAEATRKTAEHSSRMKNFVATGSQGVGRRVPHQQFNNDGGRLAEHGSGGNDHIHIHHRPQTKEQRFADIGCIFRAHALSAINHKDFRNLTIPEIAQTLAGGEGSDRGDRIFMAMQSDNSGGQSLVPDNYQPDVIELLRPRVVVRRMGAIEAPLIHGRLDLPKITAGSSAAYKAEGSNAVKSELTSDQLNLVGKELISLVPLSNRLIRVSSPAADRLTMNDMIRATAVAEDAAFIRNNTAGTPKGMRYWANASNVITASDGSTIQLVKTDLGKLELALNQSDIPCTNCGWVFAPRTETFLMDLTDGNGNPVFPEMSQAKVDGKGMLRGKPYATTNQIPVNLGAGTDESEIYFADFDEALVADSPVFDLQASDTAAYHDGSAVVSAYSRNETVVRLVMENDFAMRYDTAIAVLDAVQWGA